MPDKFQRRALALCCAAVLTLAGAAALAQRHSIEQICGDCVVERFASCGGFLEGASFDRSGQLWVVDLLSGNVMKVHESGDCEVVANTGGAPNGAKFHRDGRLFVADKNRGILALDVETGEIEPIVNTYRTELLRGVNDLVFDAGGGLYFTEPYGSSAIDPNGRVFYLPAGGALEVVSDRLAFPNGIALSPDELQLYVSEYAAKRILSIPSRSSTDVFEIPYVVGYTSGGVGADGMAVDAQGNLYYAIFQGGAIGVISADRYHYGSFALPEGAGNFVTNLAFNDGALYITEATQGVVWRVSVSKRGHPLFHQR
jgi:gluconolactonase